MAFEVEKTLSTGRRMKAIVSASSVGVNVALGFNGTPTNAHRSEAWAIIDKCMEDAGFGASGKPIKLTGSRSNPAMN